MSGRFLLPCDCGQAVAILPSQAGQSVRCVCGRTLIAPSMRGIRQLTPAPDATAAARRSREWNPVQGGLFVAGVLLLVAGLIVVLYVYPAYHHSSSFRPDQDVLKQELNNIENSTPEELWDVWHLVKQHGLGSHDESPFVFARDAARRLQGYLIAASITCAAGVLLALISLLLPAARKRT